MAGFPAQNLFPNGRALQEFFSLAFWLVGLASTAIAAVFMLVVGKNLPDTSVYREISSCLATSWSVLLGVSVSVVPRSDTFRVFFITWVCYSLAINTVFQAYLTSYLIDPGLERQSSGMDEIIDYKIECGVERFLATFRRSFNDPQINTITGKLKEVQTRESAAKRIATHKDFAYLDAESAKGWYINKNYTHNNSKFL